MRDLYPRAGGAHLVGITGPPGAGKSTLVASLIAALREAGRTAAVVAVDPSSPITGGALLGDRVRMQAYASDDGRVHPLDGVPRSRRWARSDLHGRGDRPRRGRLRHRAARDGRARARARSRSRPRPTRPSCWRRPRWATRSRRSRPACSRWPTSSWSTRATGRGRSGRRPSCGRCSCRRSLARIATPTARRPSGPRCSSRQRRPATASPSSSPRSIVTGRRRGRRRRQRPASLARRPRSASSSVPASAPAWMRRIMSRQRGEVYETVARHELDPYTAADRLLGLLDAVPASSS